MKNFRDWLIEDYADEDSIEGDFARDARDDATFPKNTSALAPIWFYINQKNACPEAKEALLNIWSAYAKARVDEKVKYYRNKIL